MMRSVALLILCVVTGSLLLASLAPAQPAPGQAYGPCCPFVKGQKAPQARTTAAGTVVRGPRNVCATSPISLVYNDRTYPLDALEVQGSLLIPARLFTLTGAQLEWPGDRSLIVTRGSRRAELRLGSYGVTVSDGAEPQTVSWPLCPRLINGVTYAPLRPLASALGLDASFSGKTVTLLDAAQAGPAVTAAAGSCPADRIEGVLGVTIMRSPAPSAFGSGAGLVTVKPDGLAASLGARAGDVVLSADGKAISCPKDLDAAIAAAPGGLTTVTVARGQEKLTLKATQ